MLPPSHDPHRAKPAPNAKRVAGTALAPKREWDSESPAFRALLVWLLLITLLGARSSAAQTQGIDPWAGVEQMIVTGSGSAAVLLEAPTSVAAFDAGYLDAIGAQDIGDIAEFTPNLEITSPFAASNPQIFIRGVGLQDSNSNASSAVAVVVDGVYKGSPAGQLSQLFDVEALEVLRGPEGVFYGRNASAGVIRLNSRKPVPEFDAAVNITYGRFNQIDLDGFVNAPVIPDLLTTRFAFKMAKRDHLGENRCGIVDLNVRDGQRGQFIGTKCNLGLVRDPFSSGRNSPLSAPPSKTNNTDNWAARSTWLLQPLEDLEIQLTFSGGQNLGKAPSFQHRGVIVFGQFPGIRTDGENYLDQDTCTRRDTSNPNVPNCIANDRRAGAGDPYSGDYSRLGDERLTVWGASLRVDWTQNQWRLKGVLGFDTNDREAVLDIDASPYVRAESILGDTARQWFFDGSATWNNDEGLEIAFGGSFLHDRVSANNQLFIDSRSRQDQVFTQKTYAAGGFVHLNYELSESLIFEAGARLNYERKLFALSSVVNLFNFDVAQQPFAQFQNRREVSDELRPTGQVILRYEPTSDLKLYGRFTRGFKGRHYNGSAITINQSITAIRPEFVNAFELGWSSSWLDGTVNWNGAAFFYDYENQQVFQLKDGEQGFPVRQLINAEDSRLVGIESDVTFRWEGFETFNSIGVQFSEYSDFTNTFEDVAPSVGGSVSATVTTDDFSGNRLVNAPAFSFVGYVQYGWESSLGKITPRLDYRFKSRAFFTAENDSRVSSEPRWLLDLRLAYSNIEGSIEVAGWIRNLTEEFYPVTGFDRKDGTGAISYVVSDPRTYGVTVALKF